MSQPIETLRARMGADRCARNALAASALLERPACPGPGCPLCNGEACEGCGAGLRTREPGARPCQHDVIERHGGV